MIDIICCTPDINIVLIIIKQAKCFQALRPSGNCVSSWMTQRGYQRRLSLPLSVLNSFSVLVLFPRTKREIDIIFSRRGGDYQRREDRWGRWHRGGSGVLQREIPSITPWASYIKDYFSFLSPSLCLLLYLTFFRSRRPFLARLSLSGVVGGEF